MSRNNSIQNCSRRMRGEFDSFSLIVDVSVFLHHLFACRVDGHYCTSSYGHKIKFHLFAFELLVVNNGKLISGTVLLVTVP